MSTPGEMVLLVATVGGTSEPVVASLAHWRPARARFVASEQTAGLVAEIMAQTEACGFTLGPGAYDTIIVPDAEQLVACVRAMRCLDQDMGSWRTRGEEYRVVVDYTGGTKTMSAALALIAHRWKCGFSYVGGTTRTKEGVGVVQPGAEAVLATSNPWDELGYRAIEDACEAFNAGKYRLAADVVKEWLTAVTDPALKRSFATLSALIEAYAAWDRFEHRTAATRLADVRKNANDFYALFGQAQGERLLAIVKRHENELEQLRSTAGPADAIVRDLLANAKRRAGDGRYDDAVARLYRSIEAAAQARLAAEHSIPNTASVSLEAVPESLRPAWSGRAEDGAVTLGLQDAYRLLEALDDRLGQRFFDLELHERTSPLSIRNQSILAHGFQAIGQGAFENLWSKTLALCEIAEADLSTFPRLGRNAT